MKFQLGQVVVTRGIKADMDENKLFHNEVIASIARHHNGDWGELSEFDKEVNEEALEWNDRILSAYETTKGKIWIITEADRSATTVLYPDEY